MHPTRGGTAVPVCSADSRASNAQRKCQRTHISISGGNGLTASHGGSLLWHRMNGRSTWTLFCSRHLRHDTAPSVSLTLQFSNSDRVRVRLVGHPSTVNPDMLHSQYLEERVYCDDLVSACGTVQSKSRVREKGSALKCQLVSMEVMDLPGLTGNGEG